MKELRTLADLRAYRDALPPGDTLGLVPTLGNLHEGHLALLDACRAAHRHALVSVFVNPRQFGPTEDLATYPRTERADLAQCRARGATAVFAPSVAEVYPSDDCTTVRTTVGGAEANATAEGHFRPVMFAGVATVLTKLLVAMRPHALYMGDKDAQQNAVVRALLRDLWLPTRLVTCATVREPDGLAMSSRNGYLSPAERARAPLLYRALRAAVAAFDAGERDAGRIRALVRQRVDEEVARWDEPTKFELAYVSVCDRWTIKEVDGAIGDGQPTVLAISAMLGRARLIDNVILIE